MKLEPKGTLEEALSKMESKNMDYFKYDREILLNCFYKMFERLGFLSKFGIDGNSLTSFLLKICENYNYAPFHNVTHVFNVTHVCYTVINANRKESYLA